MTHSKPAFRLGTCLQPKEEWCRVWGGGTGSEGQGGRPGSEPLGDPFEELLLSSAWIFLCQAWVSSTSHEEGAASREGFGRRGQYRVSNGHTGSGVDASACNTCTTVSMQCGIVAYEACYMCKPQRRESGTEHHMCKNSKSSTISINVYGLTLQHVLPACRAQVRRQATLHHLPTLARAPAHQQQPHPPCLAWPWETHLSSGRPSWVRLCQRWQGHTSTMGLEGCLDCCKAGHVHPGRPFWQGHADGGGPVALHCQQ